MTEYLGVFVGSMASQMAVLPRMLVAEKQIVIKGKDKPTRTIAPGEYIIKVLHNEDGDPTEYHDVPTAEIIMNKIGITRFEKLRKELTEAARNIVNPPNGGESTKPNTPPE